MIGASQSRLRAFKKLQNSLNIDNFDIALPKIAADNLSV